MDKILNILSYYNSYYVEPSIENKLSPKELKKIKFKFNFFKNFSIFFNVSLMAFITLFSLILSLISLNFFIPILILNICCSFFLLYIYIYNSNLKEKKKDILEVLYLSFFGIPLICLFVSFLITINYGRKKIIFEKEVNGHKIKISINGQEYKYNKDGLLSSDGFDLAVKKNFKGNYGGINMYEGDYYYKGIKYKEVLLNEEKLEIFKQKVNEKILLNKVVNF